MSVGFPQSPCVAEDRFEADWSGTPRSRVLQNPGLVAAEFVVAVGCTILFVLITVRRLPYGWEIVPMGTTWAITQY